MRHRLGTSFLAEYRFDIAGLFACRETHASLGKLISIHVPDRRGPSFFPRENHHSYGRSIAVRHGRGLIGCRTTHRRLFRPDWWTSIAQGSAGIEGIPDRRARQAL